MKQHKQNIVKEDGHLRFDVFMILKVDKTSLCRGLGPCYGTYIIPEFFLTSYLLSVILSIHDVLKPPPLYHSFPGPWTPYRNTFCINDFNLKLSTHPKTISLYFSVPLTLRTPDLCRPVSPYFLFPYY